MSIYFDFKTINELTGYNNYRQPKEFTLEELAQYDGKKGRPSYVAVEGVVYDVSNLETWEEGEHYGLTAGQDLSDQFYSCHGIVRILQNAPKVGTLMDSEYMDDMNDMDNTNGMNNYSNKTMNRQVGQTDTSKFTPDDWIRYITPVVTYALREPSQGMNAQRLYQKFILMGVLVGLGRSPQDAINQVQQWQNTGASQLLKAGTTAGTTGTGTTGGLGTGGMGTGTGTGTTGGLGTGGMGTGTGTGTTGGLGTGGMGTGTGTGTTGGLGTGGMGTGTGTGTTGGLGTGGMGTGTGTGTTGGLGTGGMGTGTGTGTTGGLGTGGMGTGTGTTGGLGTGGMGTGTGTGTMGSGGAGTGGMGTGTGTMGSGGAGTGAGTGTGGSTGSMGTRNRLFFD